MKRGALWKISVITTAESEEAVGELAAQVFNHPATSYTDFEARRTTVSIYCQTRLAVGSPKLAQLRKGLARLKSCGLDVGAGRILVKKIRRENWAESWKRHFKPLEIGNALLVKPSWSKRRARRGQAVLVLDPGLSFGTGQHPTTAFCLRELTRLRQPGRRQAFLDIGTGSGILAIAAAKVGYSPVHAFDSDAEAVRVARANARLNCVHSQIRFTRQDLGRLAIQASRRYEVVCANLISPLLTKEKQRIANRLGPGGFLIVAGILDSEFEAVRSAYEEVGLQLRTSKAERGWRSGQFGRAR
jgi:ribosomal protein L11 methyltransferase